MQTTLMIAALIACLACGEVQPVVHDRIALTREERALEPAALPVLTGATEGWDEVVVTLRGGAREAFSGVAIGLRAGAVALVGEWSRADVMEFPIEQVMSVHVARAIWEQPARRTESVPDERPSGVAEAAIGTVAVVGLVGMLLLFGTFAEDLRDLPTSFGPAP